MAGLIIGLLVMMQLTGLAPASWTNSVAGLAARKATQTLERPTVASYQAEPLPVPTTTQTLPLSAVSAYAVDLDTGQVLYSQNDGQRRPIASITKLVTALVIVRSHAPDEIVTVPTLPAYDPADSRLGLASGQRLTVEALLEAMLIPSADDAADTLAITDSGSDAAFSAKMNQLVADWGIADSHFSSPSGLIDANSYTTAQSLAKLAMLALANPLVARITATPTTTIKTTSGTVFVMTSTNDLLRQGVITGIKTGYTPAAGQSLVGLATIDGHPVVTVILGSQDRFGDTVELINYLKETYQWH